MKSYDELLAERDALSAQLASIQDAVFALAVDAAIVYRVKVIINKAPQQCLAEIRANAGRAGFVAGAEMWCDCGVESQYKADCLIGIEADADRYETKIRNTGTWLKDSNVNGGKRQGGEK